MDIKRIKKMFRNAIQYLCNTNQVDQSLTLAKKIKALQAIPFKGYYHDDLVNMFGQHFEYSDDYIILIFDAFKCKIHESQLVTVIYSFLKPNYYYRPSNQLTDRSLIIQTKITSIVNKVLEGQKLSIIKKSAKCQHQYCGDKQISDYAVIRDFEKLIKHGSWTTK